MNESTGPKGNPARRTFLGSALLGMAGGSIAALAPVAAHAGQRTTEAARRKALRPAGAPAADVGYSPGILAEGEGLVFISGQGPEDLKADMETQIRQTFQRIGLILESAGGSFENVVMIRSYWVHLLRDLPIFRKVRKEFLVEPYPASTAVGTTELAIPGLELEIEAVALI